MSSCGAVTYPLIFPCPTWEYGEAVNAFPRRTLFECGWARQRRRWPDLATGVELAFTMSTDMFDNWSTWMRNNGHNWFRIPLDRYGGEKQYQELRLTGDIEWSYGDFDVIGVRCAAEVRNG